jgi:hypothetical protein
MGAPKGPRCVVHRCSGLGLWPIQLGDDPQVDLRPLAPIDREAEADDVVICAEHGKQLGRFTIGAVVIDVTRCEGWQLVVKPYAGGGKFHVVLYPPDSTII